MLKNAITEIKLHPNRIIATLIAIAISIGFMAGQMIFVSTTRDAMERGQNLQISNADILVEGQITKDQINDSIIKQKGVAAAQAFLQSFATLKNNGKRSYFMLYSVPDDAFAWAKPVQGRWPNAAGEIALSPQAAKELGVKLGDQVERIGQNNKVTIVGITDDVNQPLLSTPIGYSAMFEEKQQRQENQEKLKNELGQKFDDTSEWVFVTVKLQPGADLAEVRSELSAKMSSFNPTYMVRSVAEVQQESLNRLTGQFDAMRNILLVFAVISLIVGMIIIANTFNILVTQRRQQIGLLRAVGATGNQIRTKFLVEAAVVGVLGSALGVGLGIGLAAIGAWWMESGGYGLSLPPVELALSFGIGVITTTVAAIAPSLRATRVSPMEALQTVPTERQAKRITRTRYAVCTVLALAGTFLVYQAMTVKEIPIAWAVGAGAALSLAILGGAPIFVPWLIRGIGRIFATTGPTTRLATANSVRNPSRSAATATALMLAVGLIVTLQVAVATIRTTTITAFANQYPVAFAVDSFSDTGLKPDTIERVQKVQGIAESAVIEGGSLLSENTYSNKWVIALAPGDQMQQVSPEARQTPPTDQEAYVHSSFIPKGYNGEPQTITGPNGSVSLKLVASKFAGTNAVIVSPENLRKLVANPVNSAMWLSHSPDTSPTEVVSQLTEAVTGAEGNSEAILSGSALQKYLVEQAVNIMLATVSALLGVAVLISLIGVANTLGLSVVERKRESGLLRALGMPRGKMRLMLLIEALLIAGTGALVGVAAGAFFGWLGTYSVLRSVPGLGSDTLVYSIDWMYTAGLLLVTVIAASLASILPGRRSANTTPTEALAAD